MTTLHLKTSFYPQGDAFRGCLIIEAMILNNRFVQQLDLEYLRVYPIGLTTQSYLIDLDNVQKLGIM